MAAAPVKTQRNTTSATTYSPDLDPLSRFVIATTTTPGDGSSDDRPDGDPWLWAEHSSSSAVPRAAGSVGTYTPGPHH